MKLLRISGSLLAFSLTAALAACGGGGGGGGTTPPTNPGGPPPPTSTPTAPPTSTPPPAGLTVSSTVYTAYDSTSNHSWGTDNWQTNGVTNSGDAGDGDTTSNVGTGQTTDGLSACALSGESQMTSSNYHVHSFVGIYVNGAAYAVPDAIGMANPASGEPILDFSCAYAIHTHADSGLIHVEDPTLPSNAAAPAQYNLQTLFDIWGQSISALPINGVSGLPAIYVGTPSGKDSSGNDLVTSYSLSTAAPGSILLSHHVAIWLVYGTPPSSGVPQVAFGLSN